MKVIQKMKETGNKIKKFIVEEANIVRHSFPPIERDIRKLIGATAGILLYFDSLSTLAYNPRENRKLDPVNLTPTHMIFDERVIEEGIGAEPVVFAPIDSSNENSYCEIEEKIRAEARFPQARVEVSPRSYSLDECVKAVFKIESNGESKAERDEPHINDTSYGLGQILTGTAKIFEKRHPELPRLGNNKEEIKESLFNPTINEKYTQAIFKEGLDEYGDAFLAVAAYNAGSLAPRNARVQQQLNDLYRTGLKTDGDFGEESQNVLKRFQADYGLEVDGKLGKESYELIQCVWKERNPDMPNPKGIIPKNNYTPNHVRKFKEALERIK
ncbi:MAG: peptidoglycan-binding protein [Nanoarchaeota archaeon]|nr:peptidoglycan-binding protein [Nanoarchaeota archaeon]